ncbi:unnamed protein product, partial [marine sediment metagenome]
MASMVTGGDATALDSLLEKVFRDTGYDFREYKRGTVTRRLERRLYATGAKTYLDYMEFLDAHPEEYYKLADDIIIKVSGFFRSPYTFQQVARLVLPELVAYKRKQGGRRLRMWSAGCARGEEPYSIAILLAEFLGNRRQNFNISIYATDISRQALQGAQAGVYPPIDINGLALTALKNYFTRYDKSYVVNSNIKQMVSFSYFD